ncbi:MAG: transglycosylase SLT domain-containing protein [Pararhodobacter sp.]|nr:transglycosylase SLT domain-containing protein [Pararhodobacter sp.]
MPISLPRLSLASVVIALLAACQPLSVAETAEPPEIMTRWDHRAEAEIWNAAAMQALQTDGAAMLELTPLDAEEFCPAYASADTEGRAAFWVAFFSGLARFESGWRPEAAGAGGRYHGLLQISPATARHHGCDLSSPRGLFDGATNLACATRIAASAVARDEVIATGRGGVARDWPPLRNATKRAEIAAFTRELPVCQG